MLMIVGLVLVMAILSSLVMVILIRSSQISRTEELKERLDEWVQRD